WRFGRVLKAAYGNVHWLVRWLAQELMAPLPAPAHGMLSLLGDGRHADKRGTTHPVAQQGRIRKHQPGFFCLRGAVLMAAWDGERVPAGCRLMLPKRHAGYRSDHALLREMGGACVPPSGAKLVLVGGEAAEGSTANRRMVQDRDKAEGARRSYKGRFFA